MTQTLSLSAQLVGDRYTVMNSLKEYKAVGFDLKGLKFKSIAGRRYSLP